MVLLKKMLLKEGFAVVEAGDGTAALTAIRAQNNFSGCPVPGYHFAWGLQPRSFSRKPGV
jgi:hypothetical protein